MDCPKGCGWTGSPAEYAGHFDVCPSKQGKWRRISPKLLAPLTEKDEKKQEIHSLTPHTLFDDLGIDPDAKILSVRLLAPPDMQNFWEPVIEIVEAPKSHVITPHTLQDDLQIGGKIVSVRLLVEPEKQSFYEPVIEIVEAVEEEE